MAQLGRQLGQPLTLDTAEFERGYETRLALPYPVLKNLNDAQIARFEENYSGGLGADLELQSVRTYPLGTTAAHLLGYVQRDDSSAEGEDAFFSYRLPDYRGVVGIESGFDALLRGHAGAEAVLVNNLGYRQTDNVWSLPEPGHNVVLTIDLDIQQAAERSLVQHQGTDARAAVVVMDVRTGDVLAMVSSPAFDPNDFAQGSFPPGEAARLNDPNCARKSTAPRRRITRPAPFSNPSSASPHSKPVWIRTRSLIIQVTFMSAGGTSRIWRRRANTISGAPSSVPATRISSPWVCRRALITLSGWRKNSISANAPICPPAGDTRHFAHARPGAFGLA